MPDEEELRREPERDPRLAMAESMAGTIAPRDRMASPKHLREAYNWVFDKIEEASKMNFNLCELRGVVKDVLRRL